jgi:putative FmdB family regulatory protein
MPIYEYICSKCTERFSMLQSIHSKDDTRCPRCDSNNVKKILSSFSYSSTEADYSSSIPSHGLGGGG